MSDVPVTLEQRIAEKVGENLVELIPPEQWQALVKKQVDAFTEHQLPRIIDEELGKLLKEAIQTNLIPYTTGDGNYMGMVGQGCNEALKKLVESNLPNLTLQMVSPAIQETVSHFGSIIHRLSMDLNNIRQQTNHY